MTVSFPKPFLRNLNESNFELFKIVATYETSDRKVTNPSDKYRNYTVLNHSGGDFAEAHSVFGAKLRTHGVEVPSSFVNKDEVEGKVIEGRFRRVVTTAHRLFLDVVRHIFVNEDCSFERIKFRSLLPKKITEKCTSDRCESGTSEHIFYLKDVDITSSLPFSPLTIGSRSSSSLSRGSSGTPVGEEETSPRSSTGSLPFDLNEAFGSMTTKVRFTPSPRVKNDGAFFS